VVLVSEISGNAALSVITPFAVMAASDLVEARAQVESNLVERLRGELHAVDTQHVDVTFVHSHGDVATELLRAAATYHEQLIAVGRSVGRPRFGIVSPARSANDCKSHAPVIVVVP
jgi:hypothetical protein